LGHGKLLVVRAILNLPTQCAVCLGWSPRRVCADCVNRHAAIKPRCVGCAIGLPSGVQRCGACITAPLPFALAVAAVDYAFPWSGLVTALKFHAALDLSDGLAQLLADAVRNSGAALPPLVLPVPLGRVRQAERGMNQAWELARRVAARLHLRAQAGLLARRVETPHLADLPRDERARAICGAFALAPGATTTLHGQHVALVDDVMTTGATAAEAARARLGGGAASVQMWVFARTP
jgi:ComF family protein